MVTAPRIGNNVVDVMYLWIERFALEVSIDYRASHMGRNRPLPTWGTHKEKPGGNTQNESKNERLMGFIPHSHEATDSADIRDHRNGRSAKSEL